MPQNSTYRGNGEFGCACCGTFLFRIVGDKLQFTQKHHGTDHVTKIAIADVAAIIERRGEMVTL